MSAQYPTVPALPGVPPLARLATAAVVSAGATIAGQTQALAKQLGLPATVTFGTNALFVGLGLQPLSSPSSSPQPDNPNPFVPGALPPYGVFTTGTVSLGPITTTFSDGSTATAPAEDVGSYNAKAVITPDSVFEFEVNADSNINTHPVELGQFAAYNRVQEPISIRMLMACQGKSMSRATFISTLKGLREGTEVVTISTPDTTYPNMTLKRWDYKKTAEHGAVTIYADTMWAEERSTNVTVSSPPTSQPQGAAPSNLGSLQPVTVTATQMGSVIQPNPGLDLSAIIGNPPVPPDPLPSFYSSTMPPSGDAF